MGETLVLIISCCLIGAGLAGGHRIITSGRTSYDSRGVLRSKEPRFFWLLVTIHVLVLCGFGTALLAALISALLFD